jgi:hypothetical protein
MAEMGSVKFLVSGPSSTAVIDLTERFYQRREKEAA